MGANFSSPGDSHTKGCLSCFIWVLKVSLRLTVIQRGDLCPLRLLPLMTEFSVFMTLQGIAPGNSWLGGVSLKDYKITWKIKREMKTKNCLGTFIVLWIKWTGMVKIKHKDFIGAAPILPCQNSSWIMSLRIYGEGRSQITLCLLATIGPLARIQDRQGLYWCKNC